MQQNDIDTIDWSLFVHAGGVATDLPRLLKLLGSPSPYVLADAYDALLARLCRDGRVYSASAAAVPFLIDLLADPAVHSKDRLATLLRMLATGHAPLDGERHPDEHFHARKRLAFQLRAALESGDARATRSAVLAGVPVYLQQLRLASAADRAALYALLGECREHRHAIDAVLRLRLPRERDDLARSACLQALIALWQKPGPDMVVDQPQRDSLRHLFQHVSADATEPLRVREAAQVGLVALADADEVEAALRGLTYLLDVPISEHQQSAVSTYDWRYEQALIRAGIRAAEAYPGTVLAWLLALYDRQGHESGQSDHDRRAFALPAAGELCQRHRLPLDGVILRAHEQLHATDLDDQHNGALLLPTLGRQALALAEAALADQTGLAAEVAAVLQDEIDRQWRDLAAAQTLRGGRVVADEHDLDRIAAALDRHLADADPARGPDATEGDDPYLPDGPIDIWAYVDVLTQLYDWLHRHRTDAAAQPELDRLRPRLIAASARACTLAEGYARAAGASAYWQLTGQVEPALSTLMDLLDDCDLLLAVLPLLAEMGSAAAPALPDLRRLLAQPQRPVRLDDRGDRVLWDEALCDALSQAIGRIAPDTAPA